MDLLPRGFARAWAAAMELAAGWLLQPAQIGRHVRYFKLSHIGKGRQRPVSGKEIHPCSSYREKKTKGYCSPIWGLQSKSSVSAAEKRDSASTLRPMCRSSDTKSPATSSLPNSASGDRKSTRLNSSHLGISYAVFCLKKKKQKT